MLVDPLLCVDFGLRFLLFVDFRLRFGSIFRLRASTAIGALLRCLNCDLGGFKDGHDVARIFNPRLLTGILFREAPRAVVGCPVVRRLPSTRPFNLQIVCIIYCHWGIAALSEPGFGGINGWAGLFWAPSSHLRSSINQWNL